MREILLVALVLTLTGCGAYDSTYWRHPMTGVIVECEASWRDGNTSYGLGTPFRDYCEQLMQRAGLVKISHEEGKQWEKTR